MEFITITNRTTFFSLRRSSILLKKESWFWSQCEVGQVSNLPSGLRFQIHGRWGPCPTSNGDGLQKRGEVVTNPSEVLRVPKGAGYRLSGLNHLRKRCTTVRRPRSVPSVPPPRTSVPGEKNGETCPGVSLSLDKKNLNGVRGLQRTAARSPPARWLERPPRTGSRSRPAPAR